jgi:hypothetical protein
MASAPKTQYTLRQIPPVVDEALRRRARVEGRSPNQTKLEVLAAGLALSEGGVAYRDLDFLRGTWVEDPAFEDAIKAQD